jgi:site-specific DNA-methyltransferase (adenine-specific)
MEYKNLIGGQVSEKISLYNCDCMDLMRQTPDNYYSLALVDPPYGIGAPAQSATPHQRKKGMNRLNSGAGKLKGRVLNNSNIGWDENIPSDEYFYELFRVSKNQIIWGGNYFGLPPTRCVICWDKVQPWENFSQIELAWTSFNSPAQIFKFDNRTGNKIHPTQKPVVLYKWLLKNYAKEGDKIFDSHLGSGSIAIACHDYHFSLVGCELDRDYYEAACKRFKQHTSQLSFV